MKSISRNACTRPLLIAVSSLAALVAGLGTARAADATWTRDGGGNWTNPTYWTPNTGSAPGSTNSTTSTDVATFGNATTAIRTITVDNNRNIFGIVFSNNSYGYVVGNGVGSILLSDGGYIRAVGSGPAVTNTNNASYIIIQGAAGTASFLNDSTNATMAFVGDVAGAAMSGNTTTLRLGGSNSSVTNIFSSLLTDGLNGGKTALVIDGGNWNFNRNNSAVTNAQGTNFTGGLTLNAGYVTTAAQRNYGTGLTTLGATSGSSNATLNISFGLTNALLVRGGSSNNTLKLEITSASGTTTVSSPLTLEHDLEVNVANTGSVNSFTGTFVGTGTLTKSGSGSMTLGITPGGNTIAYAVNGGLLTAGTSTTALTDKNRLQIGSGGAFNMSGTGLTLAGLEGSGVFDYLTGSARSMRIGGTGNYNFSGTISNTSSFGLSMYMDLKEGGVQVLSGTSENKGNTYARSGTLALDYTNNASSKLSDTNTLYLWYGNVDLRNGSTTETVAAANLQYGQTAITRTSGTSVLSLGALAYNNNAGAILNIGADNIATTATANTNGILGGVAKYIVGGANFAKNDGAGNIVGLSAGDYTALTASTNGSSSIVYSLTDGITRSANTTVLGLKISTTQSGQVFNMGANNFVSGTILFTGANDYSIQSTGTFGSTGSPWVINYGTGKLTLDVGLGNNSAYFMGTGVIKLNKNAIGAPTAVYVSGGTLEFSSNAQLGLESGTGNVTIAGGKLLANTASGSISLTNSSGNRGISLGGGDATIDVSGGNTLTVGGIIGNLETGGANPLTLGSLTASGKIVLGGVNTFTGDVKLAGGTASISSDSNLGNSANWVEFTGNATLETTAALSTARFVSLRSGKTGTFAPASGTTLTLTNYIQGAGALKVDGAGTVELTSELNSYTGSTTIQQGTLKLSGAGKLLPTAAVTNSGTLDIASIAASSTTLGSLGGSGAVNLGAKTLIVGDSTSTTVSGVISGAGGGLTKAGSGSLTLSGASANTYSGATTVSAGVLELAGTSGGAAGSTASVAVASSAKLLISQSNQVNNSAAVTLSGGTIKRGSGVSEVFGNLNLTQASFLDFGSGTAGNLTFGTYTPSSLLTVQNFFGGNTLVFGNDLTTSINDPSKFSFDSAFTSNWNGSTFTITAIPETSTYLAAAGLAGLLLWPLRRRVFRKL